MFFRPGTLFVRPVFDVVLGGRTRMKSVGLLLSDTELNACFVVFLREGRLALCQRVKNTRGLFPRPLVFVNRVHHLLQPGILSERRRARLFRLYFVGWPRQNRRLKWRTSACSPSSAWLFLPAQRVLAMSGMSVAGVRRPARLQQPAVATFKYHQETVAANCVLATFLCFAHCCF